MKPSPRQQRTLARPVSIGGFGYWSGLDVTVEFRPAGPDTGIVFVRSDLNPPRYIAAHVERRIETPRRTALAADRATVEMVEHIMAALAGLRIDNCQVWVDHTEMPAADGSSLPYAEALTAAGAVAQDALRPSIAVQEVIRVGDEESWIEARPSSSPGMFVTYHLDFGREGAIGRQRFSTRVTPETFIRDLAPARTFMLKSEADWLRRQGLGQRTTYRDLLVFDENGPIDNELRFVDECVRHKALDLVGDLALAGCDLDGQFTAYRSGHRLNAAFVRALLKENKEQESSHRWRTRKRKTA